jgi:hypothetical protein
MTTSPIYEPIAHISDDYFRLLRKEGVASSRENIDDRNVSETRILALNITDGNPSGWTEFLPEAKSE